MTRTMFAFALVALSAASRVPWNCGANIGCACIQNGEFIVRNYTYDECLGLDTWETCVFCNPDDTTDNTCAESNNPPGGLYCWPSTKQCALCGHVPVDQIKTYIAPGYTLYVREKCKASSYCNVDNTLNLDTPIVFNVSSARGLTIDGLGMKISGPCPVFTFEGSDTITIKNMTIECTSNEKSFAPAILVQKVTELRMQASSIDVTGYAKSAITVLGGDFDNSNIKTSVNLEGSVFSDVVVSGGKFRTTMDLALASFYGGVDLGGMLDYSRIIVQPALNPQTSVPASITAQPETLILYNFSEWTRLFGRDYEVILNDKSATLGYTLSENSAVQRQILNNGLIIMAVALAILMLRYYGTIVYLRKLKQA